MPADPAPRNQEPPESAVVRPVRLTRRRFLLGGLAAAQVVGLMAATRSEWRQAYASDFEDFVPLTRAAFYGLVANYAETPVPLNLDDVTRDGARTIRFSLPEASTVYLAASAGSAEVTFVHPLIFQRDNGRRYLLPLIRSSRAGRRLRTAINLGHFDEGEHAVTLRQDEAVSLPIPASLRLRATRPDPTSLLAAFMDHNPAVKLKNLDNVLDDVPLASFCKIHRHEATSRYRVTSYIIFSSENGGTMPVSLMAAYGRTVDIEWVMQQLFRPTGEVIATRRRFQGPHHVMEPFAGREMFGNSPVLVTATPNNNFSDGRIHLWRWTFDNPLADEIDDPIYYSPKPIFLPPDEWASDVLRTLPELEQWSLFELALEGCVALDDRDDPAVAQFAADLDTVRQYIQAPYPDRGCDRALRLPLVTAADSAEPPPS